MALVELTIVPLGTATTSLSTYVAQVHKIVAQSEDQGIKHLLTPMSTILEGDLSKIMALIARLHEIPFENGAERVSTSIRIDDRRDKVGTMDQKLNSVTTKLEEGV